MTNLISITRESEFIRSVIDPSFGPVSKPDDVVRKHHLKSQPVTNNVLFAKYTETSGGEETTYYEREGFAVIYPCSPSRSIGAVYAIETNSKDTGRTIKLKQKIAAAQEFSDSYDYSRPTSRVINFVSSTIAAGKYSVSGTFNAVSYEGSLSDINQTFDYDKLLGISEGSFDKVANVPINRGITCLAFPPIDDFYYRISDSTKDGTLVNDADRNFRYTRTFTGGPSPFTQGTGKTKLPTANWASNLSVDLNGSGTAHVTIDMFFDTPVDPALFKEHKAYRITVKLNLDGPGGLEVHEMEKTMYIFRTADAKGITDEEDNKRTVNLYFTWQDADISTPSTNAEVDVMIERIKGPSILVPTGEEKVKVNVKTSILAESSARQGVISPVTIVAWKGIQDGTTITISGVSNYELIPNANLMRNQSLFFAQYDREAIDLYKFLLANRRGLQLPSVMTDDEYMELKARARLYYHLDTDVEDVRFQPNSAGFFDILRTIKRVVKPVFNVARKVALPVTAALAPQAAPFVGAGMDLLNHFVPESKERPMIRYKGVPMSSSSSDAEMMFGPRIKERRIIGRTFGIRRPTSEEIEASGLMRDRWPETKAQKFVDQMCVNISGTSGAIFPVIFSEKEESGRMASGLYIALVLTDDLRRQLDVEDMPYYTAGVGKVYGAKYDTNPGALLLKHDIVLLPVERLEEKNLVTTVDFPPVAGTSHQLAANVADELFKKGKETVPDMALTGGLIYSGNDSRQYVSTVLGAIRKLHAARTGNLRLGGNSDYADIYMEDARIAELYAFDKVTQGEVDPYIPDGMPISKERKPPNDWIPRHVISADEFATDLVSPMLKTLEDDLERPDVAKLLWFLMEYPGASRNFAHFLEKSGEVKAARALMAVTGSSTDKAMSMEKAQKVSERLNEQGYTTVTPEAILKLGRGLTEGEIKSLPRDNSKTLSEGTSRAIAEALMENRKLAPYGEDALASWVLQNNGGPTTLQARYIKANGKLPNPGDLNPPLGISKKQMEAWTGMAHAFPALIPQIEAKVQDFYNGNGMKGPNNEQANQLRNEIKEMVSEYRGENPRPRPPPKERSGRQAPQRTAGLFARKAETIE